MERAPVRILRGRRLSRRRLLTALALPPLTAALASAGCTRRTGGKMLVRFWNGFTGPDGRTMLRMVQRFNAANPDIEVLMQRSRGNVPEWDREKNAAAQPASPVRTHERFETVTLLPCGSTNLWVAEFPVAKVFSLGNG
jgi:hypothetical protein